MSESDASQDIVTVIQRNIETWLSIDWESLKSCKSKGKGGRFEKVRLLIDRCDQLPAPPLADWCKALPLKWTAKGKDAGQKTWCLRTDAKPFTGPKGEVALEREFVGAANNGWWVQTPTASGFNVRGAGKRSIDLVWETRTSEFRFIELKCNPRTNNPVYAAAELIEYGIFYSAVRSRADLREKLCEKSDRLLGASAIEFRVLAPQSYYDPSLPEPAHKRKLRVLGERISEGFASLGNEIRMNFWFMVFDEGTASARQRLEEAKPL